MLPDKIEVGQPSSVRARLVIPRHTTTPLKQTCNKHRQKKIHYSKEATTTRFSTLLNATGETAATEVDKEMKQPYSTRTQPT
jgi:hypothetical protein